jgi:hypothetical protein
MNAIGKFVVVRKLGAGGMGVVYEARDPDLDRTVAIKLLNDRADPERFRQEARLAAKVSHPNCVPIHHADEHDGQFYVVMELVVGENAAQFLNRRGPLSWQTATKLLINAGRGLAAVHDAGLVHRDVKPSNVLISKTGVVKLTDFGLARSAVKDGPSLTGGGIVGTPHYMSPEQCWNEPVDARSDVYSLGATYFVLLTGRPPYSAAHEMQVMFAHCNDPVPEPRALRPELPEVCSAIVRKAMAKAPAERYQTARELVAALEAALAADPNPPPSGGASHEIQLDSHSTPVPSDPTRVVTPTRGQPDSRPTRRTLLRALPVGAAAVAAVATGGYFLWPYIRKNPTGGNGHANNGGDPPRPAVLVPVRQVGGRVGAVAVSDDDRWLAVGLTEGTQPSQAGGVKLYDRAAGDAPEVWWRWRDNDCRGVAFSPNGKLLAAAMMGAAKLRVWNMADGKDVEFEKPGFNGNFRSVAFSPDGKLLAAGVIPWDDEPGLIRVWNVATRSHVRDLAQYTGALRGVSFASDSDTLAAAMGFRNEQHRVPLVELWTAGTGGYRTPLPVINSVVGPQVAFARRAPLLAVSYLEGVNFYLPPSNTLLQHQFDCRGNAEPPAVALSPDGKAAAISLSDDIVIWEPDTGVKRGDLTGHTSAIYALAFTADGKTLISGSEDRTVREWSGF